MNLWYPVASLQSKSNILKTHVRGFFDTDLHSVSWHFANKFKMGFCFYPTLKKLIQPISRLKTASKVGDLS